LIGKTIRKKIDDNGSGFFIYGLYFYLMKKNKITGKKKKNNRIPITDILSDKWRNTIIVGLILTLTFILFYKVVDFQFVLWDDNAYITENELIRDLSWEGLKNIFTTPVIGMYNPVIFLIYAIIYKFWGLDPGAFHFFNLIFHLMATILVYKFIYKLTTRYETAAIVALLFAIHPMHVSVVTWVSGLKTSLYLIFYFLALIHYLNYVKNNYKYKYLLYAALLFILSALSKPTAVTFAPMLFLIDYYMSRKIDRRMFIEKVPFFLVAIAFGVTTLFTHQDMEDTIFDINSDYSLINNLLVSNYSIVFYIEKLFYPMTLCTIYPYPENDVFLPLKYYLAIPVIPLIMFLIYKAGKFKKDVIFGVIFFVIAISVLLRIVPSGFFRAANRYTYLSYTGLFFIIGQFYAYIMDERFPYSRNVKKTLIVLLCVFVIFCCYRTTVRIKVWENSITLFDDIIKKKPKLAMAYNNRALAKKDLGDFYGAIEDFTLAIQNDPEYKWAYYNLGITLGEFGDYEGSVKNFDKSIALNPDHNSYMMRGLHFLNYYANKVYINDSSIRKFYIQKSISDFESSLKLTTDPNYKIQLYKNIAIACIHSGDYAGAIPNYDKIIEIDGNNADAYVKRSDARYQLKDYQGALDDCNKAIELNPQDINTIKNRDYVKSILGNSVK